jgi:hypothetical protein
MRDLICSYYTLSGVSPTAGGSSPRPFEDRVRAAAQAGYRGVGIHVRDYRAIREAGASDADLKAILAHHGIRHVEVEFLLNWFADGEAGEASRRDEELLYHMAETFGARLMFTGGDLAPNNPMPFDELTARFARLCARAAERGVTVGVEPVPWTNIRDLADRRLGREERWPLSRRLAPLPQRPGLWPAARARPEADRRSPARRRRVRDPGEHHRGHPRSSPAAGRGRGRRRRLRRRPGGRRRPVRRRDPLQRPAGAIPG